MVDSQNHNAAMRKARPKGRALLAFTMVEVVMVLAIMVIIAAIAVPRYAEADARYRLEGAARRLTSDVEMARVACRADGQIRTFAFDEVRQGYQVSASSGGNLARQATYSVVLSDPPYRTTFAASKDLALSVDGYGAMHGAGNVVFSLGNQSLTLTFGSTIVSSGVVTTPAGALDTGGGAVAAGGS